MFLGLLIFVCFAPVLLGFKTFIFRDFGLFGYPLAFHHRGSFWRGEIPLWNPLSDCGLPFAAQWNTLVFYPGSLVYLLLPLPWSLNLYCVLHLYFGGLGMFFLARRWTENQTAAAFAGIVFAFNGLSLQCLMWPNNVAGLNWLPWVLLLAERAWQRGGWALLPAMLAGACQMLSGAPEIFLLTWIIAGGLWIEHAIHTREQRGQSLARFSFVVIGVTALTAVQLLPFLDLLKNSHRGVQSTATHWPMPIWGLANFLVPLFHNERSSAGVYLQPGQGWTSSYYAGVVTLALAFFALIRRRSARVWTLWILVLVSLVLALGEAGYVYGWLKAGFGTINFMRFPVKFVIVATALLPLLAAFGLAEFSRESAWTGNKFRLGGIIAALLVGIGIIICYSARLPADDFRVTLLNGLSRAAFLILCGGALWWLSKSIDRRCWMIASIAFVLIAWTDMVTHAPWQNPVVKPEVFAPNLADFRELKQTTALGPSRVMLNAFGLEKFGSTIQSNLTDGYIGHRLGLSDNANLLEGIPKADGFYSLYLPREKAVQLRLFQSDDKVREPLADLMSISFMPPAGKLFEWSLRTNYLPIISAGQKPIFRSESESLSAVLDPAFDPHETIVLPLEAKSIVSVSSRTHPKIHLDRFRAQKIDFAATSESPAIVSISQSFYHPWKAYVDGAPVPLWPANHGFQALQIPAGEHHVQVRYEDRMFRLGLFISAASWFCAILGVVLARRRGISFFV